MLRSVVVAVALMPALAAEAAPSAEVLWSRAGEAALAAAEQERAARNIPSIMIGIVSRDGLMWSAGWGTPTPERLGALCSGITST